MCGNYDDAEDVLVESLLKAYHSIDKLQDETAFRAWLVQIGRRTCGRLKHNQRLKPIIQIEDAPTLASVDEPVDEQVLQKELKRCIQTAFEQLPKDYQEVYRLKDIEGYTAEIMAQKLGLTLPNAKSRLYRARKLLRSKIDSSLECTGLTEI